MTNKNAMDEGRARGQRGQQGRARGLVFGRGGGGQRRGGGQNGRNNSRAWGIGQKRGVKRKRSDSFSNKN